MQSAFAINLVVVMPAAAVAARVTTSARVSSARGLPTTGHLRRVASAAKQMESAGAPTVEAPATAGHLGCIAAAAKEMEST